MVITYVIITYNAATVLQRTLDSVLRQDYPDIVHIIIDGASTDGTLEMVNDYISQSNEADNGHKVLVTSEPDHGIYDAMNKGLRSIDGDYVCFLNAASGGLFIPDVKHWEKLKRGDRIGRIIDPLSGQVLQNVESPVDGILFTIREYPIVDEGSLIGRLLKKEVMAV